MIFILAAICLIGIRGPTSENGVCHTFDTSVCKGCALGCTKWKRQAKFDLLPVRSLPEGVQCPQHEYCVSTGYKKSRECVKCNLSENESSSMKGAISLLIISQCQIALVGYLNRSATSLDEKDIVFSLFQALQTSTLFLINGDEFINVFGFRETIRCCHCNCTSTMLFGKFMADDRCVQVMKNYMTGESQRFMDRFEPAGLSKEYLYLRGYFINLSEIRNCKIQTILLQSWFALGTVLLMICLSVLVCFVVSLLHILGTKPSTTDWNFVKAPYTLRENRDEIKRHIECKYMCCSDAVGKQKSWSFIFEFRPLQTVTVTAFPFTLNQLAADMVKDEMTGDELMKYEWKRYLSFQNFPKESKATPMRLSQAGFYYTGNAEEVQCFSCKVRNSFWSEEEPAWDVHKRISPNCRFIRGETTNNVPIHSQEYYSSLWLNGNQTEN